MLLRLTRRYETALVAIAVLFALLPAVANSYTLFIGNMTAIYVLLAVGLNILLGYTGLLAFVNGALFGMGAYATAILRTDVGLPYVLALPGGAVIAMAIGVLIALPALRLTGLYLALSTVAFAQFSWWAFLHWDFLTNGPSGVQFAPVDYAGLDRDLAHYYVSLAVAVVAVVLVRNVLRTRLGRALVAVRESEVAAETLAIDLTRYKTLAFAISALLAGFAGGLFAPLLGIVVPESFDLFQVIIQFAMVILGGVGSLFGSVVGAVALVWMQELLRSFRDLQEIAFGAMILLTVLFFPGGIAGFMRRWVRGWREPMERGRVR